MEIKLQKINGATFASRTSRCTMRFEILQVRERRLTVNDMRTSIVDQRQLVCVTYIRYHLSGPFVNDFDRTPAAAVRLLNGS